MKNIPSNSFKSKDIDLITYLRFQGFIPGGTPLEDTSGTRWAIFDKTPALETEIVSYLSGNPEAQLLNEFRKTRSFLLDSPTIKEIGEYQDDGRPRS